jgi:dienelactone hydrolase
MKRLFALGAMVVFFKLAPVAAPRLLSAPPSFAQAGPYPVGVKTVVLVDSTREDPYAGGPRTLVTEVWYPAGDGARGKAATRFLEFFGAHPEAGAAFVSHFKGKMEEVEKRFISVAVRNAPLRTGKFPLLVFSHGNGGLRHQNVCQLDHLASHGYVIASPDHTGNAGVTILDDKVLPYDRKGRSRSSEDRPRDVSFILDRLLEENHKEGSWLQGALDQEAIGVFGHSFGGFTCCRVAESDPRVKAILPMTLAYSKPASIPVMLMLGELDRTVEKAGNAMSVAYYVGCTGPKYLLTLKRGGHFSFSDMDRINPNFGDGIGTEKTKDGKTVEFLPSELTKEIINAYSLAFFDSILRKDAKAGEFLRTNAYPEEVELRSEPRGEREF